MIAAVAGMVLLAACGTQAPEVSSEAVGGSPPSECAPVDVSLLRQVLADYEPSRSPAALIRDIDPDLIALGEVVNIVDGALVPVEPDVDQYVALEIALRDVVRDRLRPTGSETVYVLAYQGPRSNEDGKPLAGLDDWRKAVPAGTPVALMASPWMPPQATLSRDLPTDAVVVGTGMQGLVLDACGTLAGGFDQLSGSGWTALETMDDLAMEVRRAARERS